MGFFRASVKLADLTKERHASGQDHILTIFLRFPENDPVGSGEIANTLGDSDLSGLGDVENEQASRSQGFVNAREQLGQLFCAVLRIEQIAKTLAQRSRRVAMRKWNIQEGRPDKLGLRRFFSSQADHGLGDVNAQDVVAGANQL